MAFYLPHALFREKRDSSFYLIIVGKNQVKKKKIGVDYRRLNEIT